MKLISCYIENFGAITKREIIFDKNLTSICEENGSGKTTLASFLEAMFYGMSSDRANNKDFGMRRHYNPFTGGKFGGNVVFSSGEDVYKIERFFDDKSETKDSLAVYKNGEPCNDSGYAAGEKIFGIDKSSFERTIFIDAKEIEIASTGSINAKLNNFVEGTTDDTNTEKALERLKEKGKEYKKAKSGNDLISAEKNYILKLNEKIYNVENIKAGLPKKYEMLSESEEELKSLRQIQEKGRERALEVKDWEQYDELISDSERAKRIIDEIKSRYPGGIPSFDELSDINKEISAKRTLEWQTSKALSPDQVQTLSRLQNKYAHRHPAETEIGDIKSKMSMLTKAEAEINSAENIKPKSHEIELRKKFENHTPDEKELAQINAAFIEYERAEKAYAETQDYIVERADPLSSAHKDSRKYLIIAIIAAIIVVAGIGVLFAQTIAGVILIVAGALCLLATGFVYLNKKASAPVSGSVQRINPEKAAKERIKYSAESALQRLLAPYGYPQDTEDIRYAVRSLNKDLEKYNELVRADDENAASLAVKKAECERLGREISDYFSAYDITEGDFGKRLDDLRSELDEYAMLKGMANNYDIQNKEAEEKLAEHKSAIDKFCAKYGFDIQIIDHIRELEDDVKNYGHAMRDYSESVRKANLLKAEKKLDVRPVAREGDEEEITEEKIKSVSKIISALNLEISNDETEAERLEDLYAEKQQHTELLEKYKYDYDILTKTADFLKAADRRLKDRYIAPIKNKFVKYAGLLEKTLGEKVTMTSNLEISYERNGEERSEKHLSAGQRSICAFCFRIALIDNMYAEEKPFLILDDPFLNLDRKHMDKVKEMLKNLSTEMQLIYFTCHESRAI